MSSCGTTNGLPPARNPTDMSTTMDIDIGISTDKRAAIAEGRFEAFRRDFRARHLGG